MTRKSYGTRKGATQPQKSALPLYLIAGALVLIIIGVFVLVRGSSAPAKAIEVPGKPKLTVDQDKVDLGRVPLGKTVRVSFELSNAGDKPLDLKGIPQVEVKKGC